MQDWILVLTPVSLATYFLIHPDQLSAFLVWFGRLLH
jgi:hypothetical protein